VLGRASLVTFPMRAKRLLRSVINRHRVSQSHLIIPTGASEGSICPKWQVIVVRLEGEGRIWNFESMGVLSRIICEAAPIAEVSNLHGFLFAERDGGLLEWVS